MLPVATPAIAMPIARPRRRTNQRDSNTVTAIGPSRTLAGAMNRPKMNSTWLKLVASDSDA